MVPKTNLPRELGPEHYVTLEAFAHTACLVRMQGAPPGSFFLSNPKACFIHACPQHNAC